MFNGSTTKESVWGFLFFSVRREAAALPEQCGSQWQETSTGWKREVRRNSEKKKSELQQIGM